MNSPDDHSTFSAMETISGAVASKMGWDREARLWKIIRLWKEAFGEPICRVSYPSALLDKELVIACTSALWKRELSFLLPEIRAKLHEVCPSISGIALSFRVVRPFVPPIRERPPSGPSPAVLEELWARSEEIASRLPEPLRERGKQFVLRQLLSGLNLSSQDMPFKQKPGP